MQSIVKRVQNQVRGKTFARLGIKKNDRTKVSRNYAARVIKSYRSNKGTRGIRSAY